MERTLSLIIKRKKLLVAALGTSTALSSGLLAWKVFGWEQEPPHTVVDGISSHYDDSALSPAETAEELKCLVPRQLRKPWRLVHQANCGDYEQHLRAVAELREVSVSSSRF